MNTDKTAQQSDKLCIDIPILVEGKYDKIKLSSIVDGVIIQLNGFNIYKDKKRIAYIKQVSTKTNAVILLTDSDTSGYRIRNHMKSCLQGVEIHHIFTPQLKGREKRKTKSTTEGFLGVEGIDIQTLQELLKPYITDSNNAVARPTKQQVKALLFTYKLLGGDNSSQLRSQLCAKLNLPTTLSSNALVDALVSGNSLSEIEELLQKL